MALARELGCVFVETGKMYRAVAMGMERGLDLGQIDITMDDDGRLFLNGEDVTDLLHTPSLDQASSKVATRPEVRERLVTLQRRMAASRDVVMEGRDIGTVVLPEADVKIFLLASPAERALRRARQREAADPSRTLEELLTRDERDRTRDISPLNPARDAITIDTDRKSLSEVVSEAIHLVKERSGKR